MSKVHPKMIGMVSDTFGEHWIYLDAIAKTQNKVILRTTRYRLSLTSDMVDYHNYSTGINIITLPTKFSNGKNKYLVIAYGDKIIYYYTAKLNDPYGDYFFMCLKTPINPNNLQKSERDRVDKVIKQEQKHINKEGTFYAPERWQCDGCAYNPDIEFKTPVPKSGFFKYFY